MGPLPPPRSSRQRSRLTCLLHGLDNFRKSGQVPFAGAAPNCWFWGPFWLRPSPRSWPRTGQARQRPPPLSIGTLVLADGRGVKGFLVEAAATQRARDISSFGSWRNYLAQGKVLA
jgi:hypothetical protein